MNRRAFVPLACFSAAVGALVACTEVTTDPSVPVALDVLPTPLPSVVVGDSMRDSTGAVVSLGARALNSNNAVIPGAPVRYLVRSGDSIVAVDSVTGRVAALDTGLAIVIARVGRLQGEIQIRVTLAPDTLVALNRLRDTLRYTGTRDTMLPLPAMVAHRGTTTTGGDTLVPVRDYVVRFAITHPVFGDTSSTDSSRVLLVNDVRGPSRVDTTGSVGTAAGVASRALRLTVAAQFNAPPDSVVVEARAFRADATPVPGSPVRYVIHLQRLTQTP